MEVEIYKMIYNISKSIKDKDNLRIIGENFVINNKNKGNIIINNKKERIKSIIPINNLKLIKIKMVLNKNIYNFSCTFKDCELLESLTYINIRKIEDNINIEDNKTVIDNESINMIHLEIMNDNIDESEYNNTDNYFTTSQVTKIEERTDLSSFELENSSKIKLTQYINMSYMFSSCNSLKYIPDVSQWKVGNIRNMINMSYMFSDCSSLLSLPDISNWKTENINDMSYMFYNCNSLKYLPDISKWNTSNITNMSNMFYNCNSLLSFPDISKWNTINVIDMSFMFSDCKSENIKLISITLI